ncbi:MAG: hypothetical protein Q7K26_06420 [bacterium]|nr:hypothetical protein [bacterium]
MRKHTIIATGCEPSIVRYLKEVWSSQSLPYGQKSTTFFSVLLCEYLSKKAYKKDPSRPLNKQYLIQPGTPSKDPENPYKQFTIYLEDVTLPSGEIVTAQQIKDNLNAAAMCISSDDPDYPELKLFHFGEMSGRALAYNFILWLVTEKFPPQGNR